MELALASVLKKRSAELNTRLRRKRSVLLSFGLHLVLASSVFLVPILMSEEPEPLEFTPIMIVPVQALGVEEPVKAAPRREVPPQPEPEPEAAPPVVEPVPEPETPVVREPEKKPTRRSEPTPTETRETSSPSPSTEPSTIGQRKGSPTGSSLGTATFGAAVGGLDNPDFVYGYYVDQMLAMIGAHWKRPPLGAEIESMIHFRIHRDGHISDVRIVQSSGYNSYDLAGLRSIQLAAPFPKLPQSFKHNSLGVNLIFR